MDEPWAAASLSLSEQFVEDSPSTRIQNNSARISLRVGRTDRPWRAYPRLSAAPPGQAFENHRRVAAASAADAAGGMAPP